ncbi:hypothetical protein ACJ41O_011477 [Fusarium nematophilum]
MSVSVLLCSLPGGHGQFASRFFTRLPHGIRGRIYAELFSDRLISIESWMDEKEKCLRYRRKELPKPTYAPMAIQRVPMADGGTTFYHPDKGRDRQWCHGGANILFTCRQAYKEGIALLYQTNTFVFSRPMNFVTFEATAKLAAFSVLKSVDFYFDTHETLSSAEIPFFTVLCDQIAEASECFGTGRRVRMTLVLGPPQHWPTVKDIQKVLKPGLDRLAKRKDVWLQLFLPEELEEDIMKHMVKLRCENFGLMICRGVFSAYTQDESVGEDEDG